MVPLPFVMISKPNVCTAQNLRPFKLFPFLCILVKGCRYAWQCGLCILYQMSYRSARAWYNARLLPDMISYSAGTHRIHLEMNPCSCMQFEVLAPV